MGGAPRVGNLGTRTQGGLGLGTWGRAPGQGSPRWAGACTQGWASDTHPWEGLGAPAPGL